MDPRGTTDVCINYFSFTRPLSVNLYHESFTYWTLTDPARTSHYSASGLDKVRMFRSSDTNYYIGTTPWSPLTLNSYTEWPDWIRLPWMLGGKI